MTHNHTLHLSRMKPRWLRGTPRMQLGSRQKRLNSTSWMLLRWHQDDAQNHLECCLNDTKMSQKYKHIACSGEDINEPKKHLANSENNIKMTQKVSLHAARMTRSRLKSTSCMLLMGWQQDDSNAQFACCGNDTKMTQKDILQTSRMTSRGVTITSRMLLGCRQAGSEAHLACHRNNVEMTQKYLWHAAGMAPRWPKKSSRMQMGRHQDDSNIHIACC